MAKNKVTGQVGQPAPSSKMRVDESFTNKPLVKKRKSTENEGNSSNFNSSMFPAKETHHRILEAAPKNPRTSNMVEAQEGKTQRMDMDRFKKMQCKFLLKRLMIHKDGWAFSGEGKTLEIQDMLSKPLMDLATIKCKLERGFYISTDNFAFDMRIMFSNAMLYYPVMHDIHRIAVRLSDIFEMKWKCLEDSWEIEKEKEKRKEEKENTKPTGSDREISATGVKACKSEMLNGTKKRKLVSGMSNRGNSLCHAPSKASSSSSSSSGNQDLTHFSHQSLSTEKTNSIGQPQPHFLDTILTAQSCLYGSTDLQRKKEREAAQLKLQKAKRTVFIDDNLKSFEELEILCGHSLSGFRKITPLRDFFGLVLKEEFN